MVSLCNARFIITMEAFNFTFQKKKIWWAVFSCRSKSRFLRLDETGQKKFSIESSRQIEEKGWKEEKDKKWTAAKERENWEQVGGFNFFSFWQKREKRIVLFWKMPFNERNEEWLPSFLHWDLLISTFSHSAANHFLSDFKHQCYKLTH